MHRSIQFQLYSGINSSIQHIKQVQFMKQIQFAEINIEILIFKIICSATSYVDAASHPTIVQCTHQSLSSTATPKLGMIPTSNKGTTTSSHITKDISKSCQAKTTFGFISLLWRWRASICRPMSSTT